MLSHIRHVQTAATTNTRSSFFSRIVVAVTLSITLLSPPSAFGHDTEPQSQQPTRARYAPAVTDSALRFTPLTLGDGSRLTLISPKNWSDIAEEISIELTQIHNDLSSLFGAIPPFRSSVRLMDEPTFYALTGAPAWTNAMFFRGEIIIPLSTSKPIDLENLHRSVKHEYSHAVFSALSGGLIPGWIDEGLAQWIEGEENPALKNSLKAYLRRASPVPLKLLQGGFTRLENAMVPAAYAQSLLAVQAMIRAYGIEKIALYLTLLRNEVEKEAAFETAFGISERDFEQRLHVTLRTWAAPSVAHVTPVKAAAVSRALAR